MNGSDRALVVQPHYLRKWNRQRRGIEIPYLDGTDVTIISEMLFTLEFCLPDMDIELRHLRCFLAIAQQSNITKAAQLLHITQPAVSRTLRQLEGTLGVRLIDRSTRHLSLTSEGEAFREKVELAVRAVEDALNSAALNSRPLHVGHAWSAIGEHTSEILQQWSEQYPHQPLELRRFDDRTAGLNRGITDIAVLRGALDPTGLRFELLYREPRVAAIPVDHQLAHDTEVRLEQLTVSPIVINVVSGTTTPNLWNTCATRPRIIEVSNTDDWLMIIASGRGIGVTPVSTSAMYLHKAVTYIPIADAPTVPVWLAWRAEASHPAILDFVALSRQVVGSVGG